MRQTKIGRGAIMRTLALLLAAVGLLALAQFSLPRLTGPSKRRNRATSSGGSRTITGNGGIGCRQTSGFIGADNRWNDYDPQTFVYHLRPSGCTGRASHRRLLGSDSSQRRHSAVLRSLPVRVRPPSCGAKWRGRSVLRPRAADRGFWPVAFPPSEPALLWARGLRGRLTCSTAALGCAGSTAAFGCEE